MNLNIITLEDTAFYALLEKAIEEMESRFGTEELWIDTKTAMSILKISSPTTLQRYRSNDLITYSQPTPKIVVYYKPSLYEFLEKHANKSIDSSKKNGRL